MARKNILDPSNDVEILTAKELAGRVESLVSVSFPKLAGCGIRGRLLELEKEFGKGNEEIGFVIADEISGGKFFKPVDDLEAIELGMRVAVAYWTLGVTTAPLEGLTKLKIKKRNDGGNYLAIYTAGPIRSAGGTTNAMLAMIGDFLRKKFNIGEYDPTPNEIERYYLELESYHHRITRLQYFPSPEEVKHIIRNIPVELNGEATEKIEVLAYKDLPRVETNRIRGGMVLTLSMVALKAAKLIKRTKKYGEKYGLGNWSWLKGLVEKKKEVHKTKDTAIYIAEIPGGRPVFGYPNASGGFRLRYGRTRNTGLAAVGVHPATMIIADEFIAVGTQLKMELPGKAGAVSPVDSIEGPTVKLKDGSVVRVRTVEEAKEIKKDVAEIIYMGDILIGYGEFLTNGHKLEPGAWCEEWWFEEVKAKRPAFKGVDSVEAAIKLAREMTIPLHPKYTYFWETLTGKEVIKLKDNLDSLENVKDILEKLGIEHKVDGGIVLGKDDKKILDTVLSGDLSKIPESGIETINAISPVKIHAKAGRFIGTRMGRPEKAERRLLVGKPHTLFPAGRVERMRNIVEAVRSGLSAEVAMRVCPKCSIQTYYTRCDKCGIETSQKRRCIKCGSAMTAKEHCGYATKAFSLRRVNLDLGALSRRMNMTIPPLLKGVRGLSSERKIPERLEKGLLRAKYDLYVNKDGTIRVDSTDMPLTFFKPKEIRVSIERLKELGYTSDMDGNPLENDDQLLELKPQDILLSDTQYFSFSDYLIRVTKFVDELLVKFYGLEPFYNVEKKEDLIGQLVIGLAPHTSAGIIGRIIGFSNIRSGYAHPAWHAAKKRNCDGDEDSLILLMDALLNFSREFLGTNRGARTMDVPLVITTVLDLLEVDDEVHDMDVTDRYPLEFYRAAEDRKAPWDIKVETLGSLGKLTGTKHTHKVSNIEAGPKMTAYRSLGPMIEKVKSQLGLAEKIRAVDENDVASRILSTHFLKDIKGNLRQFSNQRFRCVKCNNKYRRFPIMGKCEKCKGKIILTVHEGTIKKYYDASTKLAEKYNVSDYIKSQLRLLERKLDLAFGVTEKQEELDQWLG